MAVAWPWRGPLNPGARPEAGWCPPRQAREVEVPWLGTLSPRHSVLTTSTSTSTRRTSYEAGREITTCDQIPGEFPEA